MASQQKPDVKITRLQMQQSALMKVEVEGCPGKSGKVRDVFDLGDKLILVTTDRISAFDVILPNGIPGKGRMINLLSLFWFDYLRDVMPNHVLETIPAPFNIAALDGRITVGKKVRKLPIECIARGYLTGSGWKSYQKTGEVCGIRIPPGMKQCGKLSETLFTPTTKAESGHDENLTFGQMIDVLMAFLAPTTPSIADCTNLAEDLADDLERFTILLYERAAEYARMCGIIIADTKFEFGLNEDGSLCWIDEALTPDSSRFWPADKYEPGRDQESFDKQYVRNYLEELCAAGKWDKTENNIPVLPPEVVINTLRKYVQAYQQLTHEAAPDDILKLIL